MTEAIAKAAVRAARAAGEVMRNALTGELEVRTKTSIIDLVTQVDVECERLITAMLAEDFPDFTVIGEESMSENGWSDADIVAATRDAEHAWLIDPIDGTRNFVQRITGFTCSIAYVHRGVVEVGVVYDPLSDELFVARAGAGATCNGKPIRVAEVEKLRGAVVGVGFPTPDGPRARSANAVSAVIPQVMDMRALGSAALQLAYVACGRLTASIDLELHGWDHAAGALLVQEAGGSVTDATGRPFDPTIVDVISSNGLIHEALRELVPDH